ncbi:MAG: YggS family pyridoxal phosphate-dependent enzyme [bacterium]
MKRIDSEITAFTGRRVEIIAVSKNQPIEILNAGFNAGLRIFGENKAQEVRDKSDFYSRENVCLHFIGRLQKNKIKYILKNCSMIQSLDSFDIASAVDESFGKEGRKIDALMQVNSSFEEQKAGFYPDDALNGWRRISKLKNIVLKGIMTIGAHAGDEEVIEKSFIAAYEAYSEIKKEFMNCEILSMGMSDDYKLALKNHSNMLRLGRVLFDGLN